MTANATTPPQTPKNKARPWASGKASGVPNYFIEGRTTHRTTARPRSGTERQHKLPLDQLFDRSSPERSLAAAVLMLAWQDANGDVICPGNAKLDYKNELIGEARRFLTAALPSPFAAHRQKFTGLLDLDDESFRQAVLLKLTEE